MGDHIQTNATFQARAPAEETSEKYRHDLHLSSWQSRVHLAIYLFDRHGLYRQPADQLQNGDSLCKSLCSAMVLYHYAVLLSMFFQGGST